MLNDRVAFSLLELQYEARIMRAGKFHFVEVVFRKDLDEVLFVLP